MSGGACAPPLAYRAGRRAEISAWRAGRPRGVWCPVFSVRTGPVNPHPAKLESGSTGLRGAQMPSLRPHPLRSKGGGRELSGCRGLGGTPSPARGICLEVTRIGDCRH